MRDSAGDVKRIPKIHWHWTRPTFHLVYHLISFPQKNCWNNQDVVWRDRQDRGHIIYKNKTDLNICYSMVHNKSYYIRVSVITDSHSHWFSAVCLYQCPGPEGPEGSELRGMRRWEADDCLAPLVPWPAWCSSSACWSPARPWWGHFAAAAPAPAVW